MLDVAREVASRGTGVLLAEQNAFAALSVAHRGYVLENGSLTLRGTRDELMGDDAVRAAYIGV